MFPNLAIRWSMSLVRKLGLRALASGKGALEADEVAIGIGDEKLAGSGLFFSDLVPLLFQIYEQSGACLRWGWGPAGRISAAAVPPQTPH